MTFNNNTLSDWFDIYTSPQEFPEIEQTSEQYTRLHRTDCRNDSDAVLDGLKDFPFAGTCTARLNESGSISIEAYHHFFKLSPNGVKYDPQQETMFCIKGLTDDDKPEVVEFPPELADTMTNNGKPTPWLSDFIDVANKVQALTAILPPDEETIAIALTKGLKRPTVLPRKMFGVLPPFLMKCFGFAGGSPSLALESVITEVQKYTKEYLDENGTSKMWQAFYPLMQRLWVVGNDQGTHEVQ
jgi:hypothetical protein